MKGDGVPALRRAGERRSDEREAMERYPEEKVRQALDGIIPTLDSMHTNEAFFQAAAMMVLKRLERKLDIVVLDTSTLSSTRQFGAPDIVICRAGGEYVAIDLKAGKNELSLRQRGFKKRVERTGGKYFLCRTLRNVIDAAVSGELSGRENGDLKPAGGAAGRRSSGPAPGETAPTRQERNE